MTLAKYKSKRDFTKTSEPEGARSTAGGNSFVIQKHDATRLHYDLRLEVDGVLKSWAVTKGPSLDPSEKRLAVEVEDHPLDYGGFEGTIPKGQYGAGTVILWDRGTWTPEHDAHKGLAKGHLDFTLSGERLKGRWHLVRMKDGKNWLLIKVDDEAATSEDVLKTFPDSVATGRSLADVAAGKAPHRPARRGRAKMPDSVKPMLATLAANPRSGSDWLHEIKFDGYRILARVADGKAQLFTRSGHDWTDRFGPLPSALAELGDVWIDGEVVVEGGGGASDFSALQADLSEGRHDRFLFYAFDLLWQNGTDLRRKPLVDRKQALEALLHGQGDPVRYSHHFEDEGAIVLRHACRLSLEGVISKKRSATYREGRSRDWIKSKCAERQEFVIGGYTRSSTGGDVIGSLVLGVNDTSGLRYVGRVGTGFSHAEAARLFALLSQEHAKSPFAGALDATQKRGVLFVKPDRVAEVEFRAWTGDGHLRHASFRGLREDKVADTVVAEGPMVEQPEARRSVRLTHPERIYWTDAGVTKEALADYYAQVWPRIAPYVTGRALALLRAPTGIEGQKFFQKHDWKGMAKQIRRIKDPANPAEHLIAIDDLDGLLALVQGATLEIHPWGARSNDWERPDIVIMDLDPGDGVDWSRIVAAAQDMKARLEDAGLEAFVKTSGGEGLHVCAPVKPDAEWPKVKAFCQTLAKQMAADNPAQYVATVSKSKRKGKILIDYLRNQRGHTAVAPWSTRARAGATVSMPLAWEELDDARPEQFTVNTAPSRVALHDPWEGFRKVARPIPSRP